MDLYSRNTASVPQKLIILCSEAALIFLSYLVLFSGVLSPGGEPPQGDLGRRIVLFCFNGVVFARFLLTLFHLLKRRIPPEEVASVPLAFALYFVGFAFLGRNTKLPLDPVDALGVALFLLGSFLNTGSELQRHRFKKNPANRGKLYTRGLFGLSMHINYFGDLLWVSGYAVLTRNPFSPIIPALLFVFFYFYNIPKLDAHLAARYGEQLERYRSRTRRFIPFLL
jgi:protein-S-isoprenylcysteine O-methyltransferase Ste14